MNDKFLHKMKESLLLQKKDITLRAKQSLDIDTDGDETDEIQANMLLELANQLNSRDHNRIALINDALHKMQSNTYGLCEDCEEEIPEKRLLVNPCCLTCVTCAEEREAEERQRKRL